MTTTIKELPGFQEVATGSNIVTTTNPKRYQVSHIYPYPNDNLIVGNTYKISDPTQGIVAVLISAPGGGMQTAIFGPQS